jgi:hypothetical protein
MSPHPVDPELLILVGSGLAAVGAGLLWASWAGYRAGTGRPTWRFRARSPRRTRGLLWGRSGALFGAGCLGGVIAGVQWSVVVSSVHPTTPTPNMLDAGSVFVLGVPGFLAGATVVRLLAVIARAVRLTVHRRRVARVDRGRSGRR